MSFKSAHVGACRLSSYVLVIHLGSLETPISRSREGLDIVETFLLADEKADPYRR